MVHVMVGDAGLVIRTAVCRTHVALVEGVIDQHDGVAALAHDVQGG